jgi:hypothetical protein
MDNGCEDELWWAPDFLLEVFNGYFWLGSVGD